MGSGSIVVPGCILGSAGKLHSLPRYHLMRLRPLGSVSTTGLGIQQRLCHWWQSSDREHCVQPNVRKFICTNSSKPTACPMAKARVYAKLSTLFACQGEKETSLASKQYGSSLQLALCGYLQWKFCGLHLETSENLFWVLPPSRDRYVHAGFLHSTLPPPTPPHPPLKHSFIPH